MQDRYVGDIGDFGKFALLRKLCGTAHAGAIRLGVVWCRFPDESHNNDGRHVSYLARSEFVELDKELAIALKSIVASGRRSIAAISSGPILPADTVHCSDLISVPDESAPSAREARLDHRSMWLSRGYERTKPCDLVFFDPDNGLEIASVPKHHRNAGKYIYWDELSSFWERGQTLLIYHHINRTKSAVQQVRELELEMQVRFKKAVVRPLLFRRGSCRVFWLVRRNSRLGSEINRRVDNLLRSGWAAHFEEV
jgi:hypothetical protein